MPTETAPAPAKTAETAKPSSPTPQSAKAAPTAPEAPKNTPVEPAQAKTEAFEDPFKEIGDPMAELDKLSGNQDIAPVEDEPDKEKQEPTEKEERPVEPKKEEVKQEKSNSSAKELRTALDNTKRELARIKTENEELKKSKPDETDRKDILTRYESERQRREELEKEISLVAYEKSTEYKEKYYQPLINAFETAHEVVKNLMVYDDKGNERPATPEDFNAIIAIENPRDASRIAKEVFGDAYPIVLGHRESIKAKNNEARKAIEQQKRVAGEKEKERALQSEQESLRYKTVYDSTVKDQVEKFPHLFGPVEGDEKGNELLEKGYTVADLAFSEGRVPKEQKAMLQATVRNKAAAYDRLYLHAKDLKGKLEEALKKIEAHEKTEPGAGDGAEQPEGDEDVASEIDRLAGRR